MSDADLGAQLRLRLDRSGIFGRKLGQFLAMRPDLLPQAVGAELDKLFDESAPMPFVLVRNTVEAELGAPLSSLFHRFDPEPMAVASIAQVHIACAADGQKLAVKVQRPGIAQAFAAELRTLRRLAQLSDALRLTGTLSALELLDEFADFTWTELDFRTEATTADRFRSLLGPGACAPSVRHDLSAPRVLSMEFIDGITLLDICRLHEAGRDDEIERRLPGVDPSVVMEQVTHESFRQHFDTGFFHGDPNPGNILICPDGTFAFIDFGICGELNADERANLLGFAEALVQGRFLESARYYLRLCRPTPETRIGELETELVAVLSAWRRMLQARDLPVEERLISVWQGKFAALMQKHRVRTRRNLLLVWRAWVLLDAITLRLPIEFDLIRSQARFFATRRVRLVFDGLHQSPDAGRLQLAQDHLLVAAALSNRHATWAWRLTPALSQHRRKSAIHLACAVLALGLAVLGLLVLSRTGG